MESVFSLKTTELWRRISQQFDDMLAYPCPSHSPPKPSTVQLPVITARLLLLKKVLNFELFSFLFLEVTFSKRSLKANNEITKKSLCELFVRSGSSTETETNQPLPLIVGCAYLDLLLSQDPFCWNFNKWERPIKTQEDACGNKKGLVF